MSHVQELLSKERCFLEAPAGCGKTYTIAELVSQQDGVQLVLTHTHAGVRSLLQKLNSRGVPRSKYRLDTIAGWSLRLAKYYPKNTSFFKTYPDENADYGVIYQGVTELVQRSFMKNVIDMSYDGAIVDEYQDCTILQHNLVLMLAEIIPCRILGDPLQGIFGFGGGNTLIDWETHIRPVFREISVIHTPHRWKDKKPRLGEWLLGIRDDIKGGNPIDLKNSPVDFVQQIPSADYSRYVNQVSRVCRGMASRWKNDTVVVVHPLNERPDLSHDWASKLGGLYQSIEDSDAKELQKWAYEFDTAIGNERAVLLIKFASDCSTEISTKLGTLRKRFENDQQPNVSGLRKRKDLAELLLQISKSDGFSLFPKALEFIMSSVPGSIMYRKDLWYSMIDTLSLLDSTKCLTLKETAWKARQRRKRIGRRDFQRTVSRTLLIKGLEFDHSILLDADKFDSKNLYVALTRASTSVTVISPDPILKPRQNDKSAV